MVRAIYRTHMQSSSATTVYKPYVCHLHLGPHAYNCAPMYIRNRSRRALPPVMIHMQSRGHASNPYKEGIGPIWAHTTWRLMGLSNYF